MFAKALRFISTCIFRISNLLRRIYIEGKYPGCQLQGTTLGAGVKIQCANGSRLTLIHCHVSDGSYIVADHGGVIEISDCFIGRNCVIVAREKITIGKHCQIAEMVVIRDQNHRFSHATLPIAEQGFDVAPISIGENVWIGSKSSILAGSTIGNHTVVGAHSLVRGDIESNALYVGTPARLVRQLL